jgi:hypothetical protein
MKKYEKYKSELDSIRTSKNERESFDELEKRISEIENGGGYAGISKRDYIRKFESIVEQA